MDTTPIPAMAAGKPVVPVVTSFDDNYAPYFGASLASMLEYFSDDVFYDIIIIEDKISKRNKDLLLVQTLGLHNVGLRYLNLEDFFEFEMNPDNYFAKSSFTRLVVQDLLTEYDKIIYLDPDTIILKDLNELYQIDIADYYAGACRDYCLKFYRHANPQMQPKFGELTIEEYLDKYLLLDDYQKENYFNAGVMVFNIGAMRRDKISAALLDLFKQKQFALVDQDILNKVLGHKILHLDQRWNFLNFPLSLMQLIPEADLKEYEKSRNDIWILHFVGHPKPWNDLSVEFSEVFWRYCRKSTSHETTKNRLLEQEVANLKQELDTIRQGLDGIRQNFEGARQRFDKLAGLSS
jgi:lipopolysaccharide biosynthesis glycosyltransferase